MFCESRKHMYTKLCGQADISIPRKGTAGEYAELIIVQLLLITQIQHNEILYIFG